MQYWQFRQQQSPLAVHVGQSITATHIHCMRAFWLMLAGRFSDAQVSVEFILAFTNIKVICL